MNKLLALFVTLFSLSVVFGQKNPTEEAQAIVEEGKLLYRSEMASWHGTDLFLEKYDDRDNIGGYVSYTENDSSRCVFFSRTEVPKVIGTISFDSTYTIETAKIDLTEREFTTVENDLYQIRKITIDELQSNSDGFFKFYENTGANFIPLINENEKKVYVLTGPKKTGVVIFGNDYLLTFDSANKLVSKKQLHRNIIPIETDNDGEVAMHSHAEETGDFITATDVCTLMLYQKYTSWKSHNVVSKNYLNIWNCETNQLVVLPMSSVKKISKDQKKRNKKKK